LFGAQFHHHPSASEADSCSFCHVGAQTAVADLAADLVSPFLTVAGFVEAAPASPEIAWLLHGPLPPRAPPAGDSPTIFGESRARLL